MAGRFTHINEGFVCEHCQQPVPAARKTCRNHCPYCLTSKHVDINPGDRAATCHGLLQAIRYELDSHKGLMLIFRCTRCGEERRNKALLEGECPDDYERILQLNQRLPKR